MFKPDGNPRATTAKRDGLKTETKAQPGTDGDAGLRLILRRDTFQPL